MVAPTEKVRADGTCERCLARDGREVEAYELTGKGTRELCAECAEITGSAHELRPKRPRAAVKTAEPPSEPAKPAGKSKEE